MAGGIILQQRRSKQHKVNSSSISFKLQRNQGIHSRAEALLEKHEKEEQKKKYLHERLSKIQSLKENTIISGHVNFLKYVVKF